MPDAMKAAAIIAGGPLLGGLLISSLSEATVAREPPPPLVALAADDPSPRCAHHPELASLGTCPRCGSFVCRECAGPQLADGCLKCVSLPALRSRRVESAAKRVAVAGLSAAAAIAGCILLEAPRLDLQQVYEVLFFCAVPLIFSGVQLIVRAPWPGIVTATTCGLLAANIVLDGNSIESLTGVVLLVIVVVMVLLLRNLVGARRALSESRGSAPADPARPAAPAPPP
jgi:hypothetical protein